MVITKQESDTWSYSWSRIFEEGLIIQVGTSWAIKDHQVIIDPKTKEQLSWLENLILDIGFEKPLPSDIAKAAHENKINKDRLKMMLKFLGKEEKLVFYQGEYVHIDIVNKCRKLLLDAIALKEDGINEKQFRELINGTKKLVQFLLGYFLEEGIVTKESFYIHITEKGKKLASN